MSTDHPNPLITLLAHAYYDEQMNYDEMASWADDLGIDRRELSSARNEDCSYERVRRQAEQRSPLSAAPQPRPSIRYALAVAYAHGRVELDALLRWAEEAGLTRSEAGEAMRLAADLAYGPRRHLPYGAGEAA